MRTKLIFLLIAAFTLTSCEINLDWDDPDDPYVTYSSRMIDRVKAVYADGSSDYIYYDYDRSGLITGIEDTYYRTYDEFYYYEDNYGDMLINVQNNQGEDRDIYINRYGYATNEVSYYGNIATQQSWYDYSGGMLQCITTEQYYDNGTLFSYEECYLDYDYDNTLESISLYYEESDYYEDNELEFTSWSRLTNNYNVDLLSIVGLHIGDSYANSIGRLGSSSNYLPTRATLSSRRNGRKADDVYFVITYTTSGDKVSSMRVESSEGMDITYYLSFI